MGRGKYFFPWQILNGSARKEVSSPLLPHSFALNLSTGFSPTPSPSPPSRQRGRDKSKEKWREESGKSHYHGSLIITSPLYRYSLFFLPAPLFSSAFLIFQGPGGSLAHFGPSTLHFGYILRPRERTLEVGKNRWQERGKWFFLFSEKLLAIPSRKKLQKKSYVFCFPSPPFFFLLL